MILFFKSKKKRNNVLLKKLSTGSDTANSDKLSSKSTKKQ